MKSTGEVLGVAGTLEEALYKGLIGAGYKMKKKGGVFITVRNSDKAEIGEIAKKYYDLGFSTFLPVIFSIVLSRNPLFLART